MCLRTRCHHTTHVGFAEITGHRPQAHTHLRAANQRGVSDTDTYIAMATRVWRTRSAVDRPLNLSILTTAGVNPSPTPTAGDRRAIATGTRDRTIHDRS